MATHADDALRLLRDADRRERPRLGGFEYSTNRVVLHTDTACCRAARRAGVVERRPARLPHAGRGADDDLPHEPAPVAARPARNTASRSTPATASDPDRVLVERAMSHPLYTFRTLDAQAALRDLQGWRRTYYAGAHLGYGFHEDGCRPASRSPTLVAAEAEERAA